MVFGRQRIAFQDLSVRRAPPCGEPPGSLLRQPEIFILENNIAKRPVRAAVVQQNLAIFSLYPVPLLYPRLSIRSDINYIVTDDIVSRAAAWFKTYSTCILLQDC